MPTVEFEGVTFVVDEDGFLEDFNTWNETWMRYIASIQGVEQLTDEHFRAIEALQDFYRKNNISPMARILFRITGHKSRYIYELFPRGPGHGACKMAGLPKPTGCV